jgi:hypothetical protein
MSEKPERSQPWGGAHGESKGGLSRLPRWPGAASLVVIGVVYAILREDLRVAPSYLYSYSWRCFSCRSFTPHCGVTTICPICWG